MSLIDFQSYSEIKKEKEIERKARENILCKAKEKYERNLRREEEAQKRGETTWMLPSVEDKIKSHKKKKKEKKKKSKKEKKSKRRASSVSSSGSETENQSNLWVEKSSNSEVPVKRDEWMELPSLFKTQTREQMKIADGSSRALQKLQERKRKEEVNKPGSHSLELNPYYADGGSGLPSASVKPRLPPASSYDASWLLKALERAKSQASEEGRSLEEVAKERWGSLETFNKLLEEAEGKRSATGQLKKETQSGSNDPIRRRRSRSRSRSRRGRSRSRRGRSRSRSKNSRRSRSRSKRRSRSRSKRRSSRSKGRSRSRSKGRSRSDSMRSRNKRTRSRSKSGSSSDSSSRSRRRSRKRSSSSKRGNSSERGSGRRYKYDQGHKKDKRKSSRRSSSSSGGSSSRSSSCSEHRPEESLKNDRGKTTANKPLMMLKPCSDDESPVPPSQMAKNSLSRDHLPRSSTTSWRKKGASLPSKAPPSKASSSSESSSSDTDASEETPKPYQSPRQDKKEESTSAPTPLLTDKEMNQLAAKLTKAELMGNEAVVKKLKTKLEAARAARDNPARGVSENLKEPEGEEIVVLTRTDTTGFTRPVSVSAEETKRESGKRKKKKKIETFDADGQRVSYYADDFKVDLQTMFEKEKTTSAADQIAALENLACANTERLSDDFDVDDMFISKVAPRESGERERERDRQKAILEHQRTQKTLDSCHFCVDNKIMKKHLIIALGTKCYLSVPYHKSLTEGHCLIAPLHHVPCGTQADEDLWAEMMNFRQALVRMFSSNDEDCVFFETAKGLHHTPHMILHCVPLPRETGELAPIYFKKAILECDEEWAQNKKLIDLKGRDVRRAIPKGLPYFCVDFGLTPGFAHVIENEALFPANFAQEILGGMMDADFSLYRKPKAENFDVQRKKVLKFAEMFKAFDPT